MDLAICLIGKSQDLFRAGTASKQRFSVNKVYTDARKSKKIASVSKPARPYNPLHYKTMQGHDCHGG